MRLNKTPARVGQQTLDRLTERQADVGGVILNCDEPRFSSYKSYGYYRYYDSVEVHAKKRAESHAPAEVRAKKGAEETVD